MKKILIVTTWLFFSFIVTLGAGCYDTYQECEGWATAYLEYDIDMCETQSCMQIAYDHYEGYSGQCTDTYNGCADM